MNQTTSLPDSAKRQIAAAKADKQELVDYLRSKVNQLLEVTGTQPLKPEELDEQSLISLDPIGVIAESFRQILEHQQTINKKLKIANDELNEILDTAGAAIIVTDAEIRMELCNELAEALLLDEKDKIIGKILCQWIKGCPYKYDYAGLQKAIASGEL